MREIIQLTNTMYKEARLKEAQEKEAMLGAIRAGASLVGGAVRAGIGMARGFAAANLTRTGLAANVARARTYMQSDAFKSGIKDIGKQVAIGSATNTITNLAAPKGTGIPTGDTFPKMGVRHPLYQENSVFNRSNSFGG